MNRKQRRAAARQSGAQAPRTAAGRDLNAVFAEAGRLHQQRQYEDAALAYKRVLALDPDHAEAANNLGCVLQLQGRLRDASAAFARALELAPQLFNDFGPISATLTALVPSFGQAMREAARAWPERLNPVVLLGGAPLDTIADDPLLLTILRSGPVRDIGLEYALTAIRGALLQSAVEVERVDRRTLAFCAALAEQCFINEYVFAVTRTEDEQVSRLIRTIEANVAAGVPILPRQVAALAMYVPLHRLAFSDALLEAKWPAAVGNVLKQQIHEPREELTLRASIPALTPIADEVSNRVRQQYEDNPYPRWVRLAAETEPLSLDAYLNVVIPGAAVPPLPSGETCDMLVAGCGTGSHPIGLAQKLKDARVLAVDLSLSSLAYARRKTPPEMAGRIEYAQADILSLGELGRRFDVIDSRGVLHHMADPAAGLRVLTSLLRPGGLMSLGLYSQCARQEIGKARRYLAERGYRPTPEDIRRARQDILESDLRNVARANDFFTTSECRDLLFHVQEHQMTIPQIKLMLAEHGLDFIGFAFDPATGRRYAEAFAGAGQSFSDLDAWHAFEQHNPDTFRAMYQFWCRKP